MSRLLVVCIIISLGFLKEYHCASKDLKFRTEGAKIPFVNPKYVKDVFAFTSRVKRNLFVTTINVTLLQPWYNNVSLQFQFENKKIRTASIKFDLKVCDWLNMGWAAEWLKSASNIVPGCPLLANSYHFHNVELPPKNFPVAISEGDYRGMIRFYITKTKDRVIEFQLDLRCMSR